MITNNILRNSLKNKLLLIISGSLVIVGILINIFCVKHYSSNNSAVKQIQHTISQFEIDADILFNKFTEADSLNKTDFSSFVTSNTQDYFTTLVYVDSSLVYWSNNVSNYPWYINPLINTSKIIETNNSTVYNIVYSLDSGNFLVAQLPLTYSYNIDNKYLEKGLSDLFNVDDKFNASFDVLNNSQNIIYDSNHSPLFSIFVNDNSADFTPLFSNILFIVCALYIIILVTTIINCNKKIYDKPRKLWIIAIVVLLLRLILLLITNRFLGNTKLFIDKYFHEGFLFDSVGNLLITSTCLLIISIVIFTFCYQNCSRYKIRKPFKIIFFILIVTIILITFLSINKGIIDTSLQIKFFNLSNITLQSVIITIAMTIVMSAGLLTILSLYLFITPKQTQDLIFKRPLIAVFLTAVFLTLIYNNANLKRERLLTEFISKNNIFTRNQLFENNLTAKIYELKNDSTTNNINKDNLLENGESQHLNDVIDKMFDEDFWPNYYINYIIADSTSTIRINYDSTIYYSNEYFSSIAITEGLKVDSSIWYINDIEGIPYYLCKIHTKDYNIWIDVIPKFNIEGSGYPELLSTDDNFNMQINLSELSLAVYNDNILVRNLGSYTYPVINDNSLFDKKNIVTVSKKFKHFIYTSDINNNIDIVITKPYSIVNNYFFPLSVLFISFLAILLLLRFIFLQDKSNFNNSINIKLQISVLSFFIATTLLIGAFSILLIVKLNNNKNTNALQNLTYSLLKEIELFVNTTDSCSNEEMYNIINDLSYTNFLDINVYDEDGYLYCTSNEEMFNNNLTSNLINPIAFSQLINNNRYFCKESIGKYKFLSSYIVLIDNKSDLYIINIPYFTKQTELKKEISDYITSFLNIYTLIVLISVIIAYYITRYIVSPLKIIQGKIENLSIKPDRYDKIEYTKNDEIGSLVAVYNNKVDELKESADLLAKSEREMAWREMARQVAHEIKNPLTPMKLSTQYIYKMWKDNNQKFDSQFEKYKESTISEIDNLSDIASAFSDFAKMPAENRKRMNINDLIYQIIDFYKQSNIDISYKTNSDDITIFADTNLLSRVFHNIIRNAIQAFNTQTETDNNNKLKIIITSIVDTSSNNVYINIKDNGPGINENIKEKIFTPNFTTKSSGAGLGLAIVKNIVENMKGTIRLVDNKSKSSISTIYDNDVHDNNNEEDCGAEFEITFSI